MFGTGKTITENSIDFDKLARIYLSQHPQDSDKPEDFLARFIRIREAMKTCFNEEKKTKTPVSAPPTAAYDTRRSPW